MGRPTRWTPGTRQGAITIIDREGGTSKYPRYRVKCDCGKVWNASGGTLWKAGGCRECRRNGAKRLYGDLRADEMPLYRIWTGMRRRCNPQNINDHTRRWAGRGISVCAEWNDFRVFDAWSSAHGYRPGLTLDRIDNDGNYEPSNCEWVTRSENSRRVRALYKQVRVTRSDRDFPWDAILHGAA